MRVTVYCARDTVTAKGKSLSTILLMTFDAEEAEYQIRHKINIFSGRLRAPLDGAELFISKSDLGLTLISIKMKRRRDEFSLTIYLFTRKRLIWLKRWI